MAERYEDSGHFGKMKKLEKTPVSNYREYLDMDTDEEEFGRQETPEPEEETEIEPEKPVFTREELDTLVRYMKDLTTLPSLVEADWSQEVIDVAEEYFCNPANTVLTIFWEKRMLKALLEFPSRIDRGLTYFLRSPWQVYTADNFLATVIFGSIDGDVDNSTLKFMENIYAPIAFRSDEWPTVVKNEIFSNLHEFLLCLTDITYSPMGLTILYIPREGLQNDKNLSSIMDDTFETTDEAISGPANEEDEEGLLERLERVARYWIKQIRQALKGTSTSSSPWKTIVDEIRYWQYRYENLSCVHHQLTNKSVLSIVQKLESVRSASVNQYKPLAKEVERMLEEANSNIKYLSLLEEFSKGFDIPDGIEDYATRILLLIRFVGTESPFYNTRDKIETLCRAFCVQTVEHCRAFIDLDLVLEGDPDAARKMLVKCIESCDKLSTIYDRLADMDRNSDSPSISLTDKTKVFSQVDTLIHRCNDLIGIASARIAFDKCDKPIAIFGPKGLELGERYRNIEERFNVSLSEIKNERDIILDMVSADWLEKIVEFRRGLKDIENMVKNWIDDIFKDVFNVEEGIEALYATMRFSLRPYLRETLNNKWIEIWKMFGDELDDRSEYTKRESIIHHPSLPPFSGRAHILRCNKMHLIRQHKILIDASDWFGDCDAQEIIIRKYKRVLAALTEKEDELFSDWQQQIIDKKMNSATLSNQSIIKYVSNTKNGPIVPTLQMFYLDNIKEVGEWALLDYDSKNILSKDFPTWKALRSRYNKVDYLCKMYNGIVVDSADRERNLCSTMLNDLEETLRSGFTKITWTSDSFERFITDCLEFIEKIKDSFKLYRSVNCKVDYFFEKISGTSLLNIDYCSTGSSEDCDTHLEQQRCEGVTIVGQNFKIILQLLLELKSQMNAEDEEIANHWDEYVNEIYEKSKISLTNCMRLSLLCASELFHGDEDGLTKMKGKNVAEKAIARITATALEDELPIDQWTAFFDTRDKRMLLESVDQDPESIELRKEINYFLSGIQTDE